MRTTTRATALLSTLLLGGALAACGDLAQEAAGTAHNDADTAFVQMMVVHHEGAIDMGDVVARGGGSPEVVELAESISAAQGPEIETMNAWLDDWDEKAPVTAAADHAGMDHGDMLMDDMDHATAMTELEGLTGAELDERFLELMIDHHEGAVHMAEEEVTGGKHDAAKELARTIIDTQTAEIATMQEMLDAL